MHDGFLQELLLIYQLLDHYFSIPTVSKVWYCTIFLFNFLTTTCLQLLVFLWSDLLADGELFWPNKRQLYFPKCGNPSYFLSLIFYVKSNLVNQEHKKIAFSRFTHFCWVEFCHLISRKISVTEKFCKWTKVSSCLFTIS